MACIQCNFCGRTTIQSLDIDVCTMCIKRGNDAIKIYAIKKYLEKNPDARIREIREALEIDQETLDRFLKDGSIELVTNVDTEKMRRIERLENFRKQVNASGIYGNKQNNTYNSTNRNTNYYNQRSQLLYDLERKRENTSGKDDDLSR